MKWRYCSSNSSIIKHYPLWQAALQWRWSESPGVRGPLSAALSVPGAVAAWQTHSGPPPASADQPTDKNIHRSIERKIGIMKQMCKQSHYVTVVFFNDHASLLIFPWEGKALHLFDAKLKMLVPQWCNMTSFASLVNSTFIQSLMQISTHLTPGRIVIV